MAPPLQEFHFRELAKGPSQLEQVLGVDYHVKVNLEEP